MKKARIVLLAILLLTAASGMMAFKVSEGQRVIAILWRVTTANGVTYCTTSPYNSTTGVATTTTISLYKSSSTTISGGVVIVICVALHVGPIYVTLLI